MLAHKLALKNYNHIKRHKLPCLSIRCKTKVMFIKPSLVGLNPLIYRMNSYYQDKEIN